MSNVQIDLIGSAQLLIVLLGLSGMPCIAHSGGLSEPCVRPEAPISVTVEAADAYHDLINADYDAYFAAATAYVSCLDGERARALSDMAKAVEDYEAFLATPVPGASP